VYGCIIAALTAITFGTSNIVTVEEPEVVDIPAVIDFPALASATDEIIIACLPLTDGAPPAACDALPMEADMMALLNTCTSAGISNANARRRASGLDILPQLADMVMTPTPTFNQPGGPSRRLRRERRLELELQCYTTGFISLMTYIQCCYLPNKPSWCASPTNINRRELNEDGPDPQAYLEFITDECTAQ
jgi:hypothetical protein